MPTHWAPGWNNLVGITVNGNREGSTNLTLDGVLDFDRDASGLVPVSVATWESFVLVHLDPEPMPIEAHLGGLVDQIAPLGLGALCFDSRTSDARSSSKRGRASCTPR